MSHRDRLADDTSEITKVTPGRTVRALSRGVRLLAFACAALAACGGVAVIDSDGVGGANGAGGSATNNNAVAVTVVSSSTGTPPSSLCVDACNSLQSCSDKIEDCLAGCEGLVEPCRALHQTWLGCGLGEANTMCGSIPGQLCVSELNQYIDCVGGFIDESCDAAPGGGCQCFGVVNGGQFFYEQFCDSDDSCFCLRDGELVGGCAPNDTACGITDGCCAGVFFTGGGF